MKKKPRFFCDNCSYEVGSEVKTCPYCARHFESVRCPICSYSGPDRMFQSGCPMCGYSAPASPKLPKMPKSKNNHNYYDSSSKPLPFWTLISAFIGLLFVIAALSWLITR